MFLWPINETELINIVTCMPAKLSCGFDEIPIKVIKSIINSISIPLTKIFNKSFLTGSFPNLLKIAKVCPIYKQGDKNELKNYRPISLLPSFAKILEKLMHARLLSFLQTNNVINSSQHGFQPNKSTSSAIADALHVITSALDKKLINIALFVDVSKAFDSLDHSILIKKLEHYGIRGLALQWFISYLSNRYQYTIINRHCSDYRLLVSGVPQGSVLGPILYLLYVNDIFNVSKIVKTVLYADDTVLIVSCKTLHDVLELARVESNNFSMWFSDNLLALNASKTNFMLFGSKTDVANCPDVLHFDVHYVCRVNHICYLGLVIDSNLTWKQHIQCVNDKMSKGLAIMKKCSHFLPSSSLLQLYYAFFYSYMHYCIEFWGFACKQYLHPVLIMQKRAIRLIAGADFHEHCLPIARRLGILMLNDICKYCILMLVFKVLHKPNECPYVINDMFTPLSTVTVYTTRHTTYNFFVRSCNSNVRRNFVGHQGVVLWNALPQTIKKCKSLYTFKQLLKDNIFVLYV
jgi:hypothetical protein